jgi:hypothetical protein
MARAARAMVRAMKLTIASNRAQASNNNKKKKATKTG